MLNIPGDYFKSSFKQHNNLTQRLVTDITCFRATMSFETSTEFFENARKNLTKASHVCSNLYLTL